MKEKRTSPISKRFSVILLVFLVACSLAFLFINNPTRGLVEVEGYIHYDSVSGLQTCLSESPECGYCPGEVINEQCYVDPKDDNQNYILR